MKYLLRVLVIGLIALPLGAHAATLSISPGAATVSKGNIISVRIVTNTQGDAINEADGTLQFPHDLLDVVSVSKSSSIFSLWVEDPVFSNSAGTISFNGGLPNPGFTGSGTVLTVTFHAKTAGNATLSFADAAVRANDGFGSNVLTNSGTAQLTVTDTAPPTAPLPTPQAPSAPQPVQPTGSEAITGLVSSTHPDQSTWYASANAHLSWVLPDGALAVETGIASSTKVVPGVLYQPAITEKQVQGLVDGIAYFNIRAKTTGGWGPVSSYRLQIDTTPPSLGNPNFSYDLLRHQLIITGIVGTDTGSGVTKYELTVDGGQPVLIRPEEVADGTYAYTFRANGDSDLLGAAGSANSGEGTHSAVLTVFDQAGNHASATGAFVVPLALVDQSLVRLFGINVTFLWFIIAVLLLMLGSLIAAAAAWWRLYVLRQSSKSRVAKRDIVMHRALSLFKTDFERHLKSLEHASTSRELTLEEQRIRTDLADNLSDLERYLKKEFKKFD